jgi:hypothetical protein
MRRGNGTVDDQADKERPVRIMLRRPRGFWPDKETTATKIVVVAGNGPRGPIGQKTR